MSRKSILASASDQLLNDLKPRVAIPENEADWQRVNSYVADVLKDCHVLYAKLARLQGDFNGSDLEKLEQISTQVLDMGVELSNFSRDFFKTRGQVMKKEGGMDSLPQPQSPDIPPEFDVDTDIDSSGGDDSDSGPKSGPPGLESSGGSEESEEESDETEEETEE